MDQVLREDYPHIRLLHCWTCKQRQLGVATARVARDGLGLASWLGLARTAARAGQLARTC